MATCTPWILDKGGGLEDTAASQVQAAAMEEAAQVQLAAVEAGAEASQVQVQRAMSVLVKEKALPAAEVQAAAMAEVGGGSPGAVGGSRGESRGGEEARRYR